MLEYLKQYTAAKDLQPPSNQTNLDFRRGSAYACPVTMTAEVGPGQLAELVKQVQAGNEVLLTQDNKPVAKIIPTSQKEPEKSPELRIRSLQGHRVLTPVISQAEIAEEMFERK